MRNFAEFDPDLQWNSISGLLAYALRDKLIDHEVFLGASTWETKKKKNLFLRNSRFYGGIKPLLLEDKEKRDRKLEREN